MWFSRNTMKRYEKWELLSLFLLIIPINIYSIGDFLGAGISFPFFKFQNSFLGLSIINFVQDLSYIQKGIYFQRTAFSVEIWTISLILLISTILIILSKKYDKKKRLKLAGLIMIISTIGFLISIMVQFGPLFHGSVGIAIPIGMPALFTIGGLIYVEGCKAGENAI